MTSISSVNAQATVPNDGVRVPDAQPRDQVTGGLDSDQPNQSTGTNSKNPYRATMDWGGTAFRHMFDTLHLGIPGHRYNARDSFRTEYSDQQRNGAMFGQAVTTAGIAGGLSWIKDAKGVSGGAKAIAAAYSLGLVYSAGKDMVQMSIDTGDLSDLGTAVGAIGGGLAATALGSKFGGVAANPLTIAAATGIGALGMNQVGKAISTGDGNIGTPADIEAENHNGIAGKTHDFVRGGLTNFIEYGPTSFNLSFASGWNGREDFATEFSRSDQAGAMLLGDLGAASFMVGSTLASVKAIQAAGKLSPEALKGLPGMSGMVIGKLGTGLQKASASKAAIPAVLALGGVALAESIARGKDEDGTAGAVKNGLGTAAEMGLSGLAATSLLGAGVKPANALVSSALIYSLLANVRPSMNAFLRDARVVHDQADQGDLAKIQKPAIGVGAAAGAVGAGVLANRFGMGKLAMGATMAAGAATGAAVSYGTAPLLPMVDKDLEIGIPD